MKGLRLSVGRTKSLSIGRKGINNLNYAKTGGQVKFIDTIKVYQELLSKISTNTEASEKENIKKSLIVFLETNPKYKPKHGTLTFENKLWIVNYLSSGKDVIPYESIKIWEDLKKHQKQTFLKKLIFTVP